MYITDPHQEEDRLASGGDSLREFAHNAGMDNPTHAWLLDGRDVWVANPYYSGSPVPHPEEDYHGDQGPKEGETPPLESVPEPETQDDCPF